MTEKGKYLLSLKKSGLTIHMINRMYKLWCQGFTYAQIKNKVQGCKDKNVKQIRYRFLLHEKFLGI